MSDRQHSATEQRFSDEKGYFWTLPELLKDLESGSFLYLTPKMGADLAAIVREATNNASVAQSERRPSRPGDGETSDSSRCTPVSEIAPTDQKPVAWMRRISGHNADTPSGPGDFWEEWEILAADEIKEDSKRLFQPLYASPVSAIEGPDWKAAYWRLAKNMDIGNLADYDDELASEVRELREKAAPQP